MTSSFGPMVRVQCPNRLQIGRPRHTCSKMFQEGLGSRFMTGRVAVRCWP